MSDFREGFEAWAIAPPFEFSIERYGDSAESAWPGNYRDYAAQLAWDAWKDCAAYIRQHDESTIADLRAQLDAVNGEAHADRCAQSARLKEQLSDMRERLDIAERALIGHGYRKSCGIPACNCGDQWNHGGLARERLGEIDDVTRDYYQNGETLLMRVQRIVAELDKEGLTDD